VDCNFADGDSMNGMEILRMLELIDGSIHANMDSVREEIVAYLNNSGDELLEEISKNGFGYIPTRLGRVKISEADLKVEYA
jgi:hypothetical protein